MLIPTNNYICVNLVEEVQTETGVLIPDGVEINKQPFRIVNVVTPNLNSRFSEGTRLIVPTHMVEEVVFSGQTHYLVLENHVVGYLTQKT